MATGHTRPHNILKHLECPICMEKFKVPRSLPKCLHSFCHECLVSYLHNASKEWTPNYHCPFCREVIDVNCTRGYGAISTWVEALPLNHVIVSLLDEVSDETQGSNYHHNPINTIDEQSAEFCKLHRGRLLEYFCADHDTVICESCVAKFHRKCHNVEDLQTVLKVQDEINDRMEKVKAALIKSVDMSKNDVTVIDNADKQVQRVMSDFKLKLQELLSLADAFEIETLKMSKDLSSQMTDKKQMDVGMGLNWLESLEEAHRNCTQSISSATGLLKSRGSLVNIMANCESFVQGLTHVKKPLFALMSNFHALEKIVNVGFGKLHVTSANESSLKTAALAAQTPTPAQRSGTVTEPKQFTCTITADVAVTKPTQSTTPAAEAKPKTSGTEPVAANPPMPIVTARVGTIYVSEKPRPIKKCAPVIESIDLVEINVPQSKVPHYSGVTYLPDGRVVMADSFHKRLVLLDQNFRHQSTLVVAPQKPTAVIYIGNNELAVALVSIGKATDHVLIIKISGRQLTTDRAFDVWNFNLCGMACLGNNNSNKLMYSTRKISGICCLNEVRIDTGAVFSKFMYLDRNTHLKCVNGFTVDTTRFEDERLQRIYIHAGCDDHEHDYCPYRLICTNMDDEVIFEYKHDDLVHNSSAGIAVDGRSNVFLCNRKNIHVISKEGQNITIVRTGFDDILAIAFNQRKDRFVITHNAWKDRKVVEEFQVSY